MCFNPCGTAVEITAANHSQKLKPARYYIANKSEINNTESMACANNTCAISVAPPKAFNSPQPFTSKSSILRLRNMREGAIHGLSLEESHPWIATFRMF